MLDLSSPGLPIVHVRMRETRSQSDMYPAYECSYRFASEMPTAFSTDLRWRIVWLKIAHDIPTKEIAVLLGVSERTVRRILKLFNTTGDVKPKDYHHGPMRLLGDFEQLTLLRLILERPGIYLHEIQAELYSMFEVQVSVPTICKTLRHMGCTRQVIRHIAAQRSEVLMAKFMSDVAMYDPQMLVWIDETGCDRRNATRKYAYGIRGITPCDHRIIIRGQRYSVITVMSIKGVLDAYIVESTVNGDVFEEFTRTCLLPILQPFDYVAPHSVVILDNASIHHVASIVDMIKRDGKARILFLPPYCPELMPLEEVFSKVKSILKSNDALFQATSAPRPLLATAFGMVTEEDCIGYIRHAGYL